MLSSKKKMFAGLFDILIWPIEKLGLSPNQVTLLTPVFAILYLVLVSRGFYLPAVIALMLSVLIDALDGHLARRTNRSSVYGAYLDTILDRYVEFIIYLSFLLVPLPKIGFSPEMVIALCIFGSLMTTYSKAAYTEKTGKDFSGGFFERAERMLLVILAVILMMVNIVYTSYLLLAIAALTNFSAVGRIIKALQLCAQK